MIAFYNSDSKLIGTADIVDGKLVTEGDVTDMSEGYTPQEFMDRYTDFNNGYLSVYTLKEGATPPEELSVTEEQIPSIQV